MSEREMPTAAAGPLLLADISGYTSFLQAVADAHRDDAFAGGAVPPAYTLMADLLDGIVRKLAPPFTLSKLEGDAVFAYAVDEEVLPRGSELLACFAGCYADFRGRLADAYAIWSCRCAACSRIDELDLKFVLHAGPFVIHSVAGGRELVGPEVVMAHRLLKTTAAERVGHGAYVLVTDAAAARFGVPTAGAIPIIESVEHYPAVHAHVLPLRRT